MRFVIISGLGRTGGPEALHQLAHMLTELGTEAEILYMKEVRGELVAEPEVPCQYHEEYPDLTIRANKEFEEDTVLVIPEVWANYALLLATRCFVLVWWLSVDNGLLALGRIRCFLDHFRSHPRILHAYQSDYAKEFLASLGLNKANLALSDYTRVQPGDLNRPRKNFYSEEPPRVSYNPLKGGWLAEAFREAHPEVRLIALSGMSTDELWTELISSYAYIDFGYLPGKDRLPREALKAGTRVFLRQCGDGTHSSDWLLPRCAYFTTEDCFTGELHRRLRKAPGKEEEHQWQEARLKVNGERRVFRQECETLIYFFNRHHPLSEPQRLLSSRLDMTHRFLDELTLAEQQLFNIRNSTSWKITAPIRQSIVALKGRPQGSLG